MAVWLVCPLPTGAKMNGWRERISCEREPCRTIATGGLGGGSQYWLEDDGMPLVPPNQPTKPWRVPSMAEVRAMKPNGYLVASTFSGCGGSSLGYRMAGFSVGYASEFIEAARDSYRANCDPDTFIDDRDIRVTDAATIRQACEGREVDLLDGSPPCASFSPAGKREKSWGKEKSYSDKKQRTDDLFFEFVRILDDLQPRTFVAENVAGLTRGVAKGYFIEILKRLKACGYRVKVQVLDAAWLGVPQHRQRTIFIGVRNDLAVDPVFPTPLKKMVSMREAIPWLGKAVITGGKHHTQGKFNEGRQRGERSDGTLPTVRASQSDQFEVTVYGVPGGDYDKKAGKERPILPLDGPSSTIIASGAADRQPLVETRLVEPESSMDGHATGKEWDNVPVGGQSEKYFQLVKPDPSGPCPTVTAAGGNAGLASVAHPTERRKFSIAELRRICAFPDDFVLTGSYEQQWERLGRAVPPVMMFWIARGVRELLLKVDGRPSMIATDHPDLVRLHAR